MTDTGVKGLDLYCLEDDGWHFVRSGRPTGKTTDAFIIENMTAKEREFILYLPMYDGLTELLIGIDDSAGISAPAVDLPSRKKPVVFYGTSIMQGGCASRSGMASSNIIGKGPGNSVERDYLPQAFSDFIFSIIIEEMGLIGAIVVVFLYIIVLFRAARIAGRCENNFPAFLVMGLAVLLVAQAAITMMVAVDIGPVTGQPLPLVSKGGTSTLVSCAYIGAILSVSRSAKKLPPVAGTIKIES